MDPEPKAFKCSTPSQFSEKTARPDICTCGSLRNFISFGTRASSTIATAQETSGAVLRTSQISVRFFKSAWRERLTKPAVSASRMVKRLAMITESA